MTKTFILIFIVSILYVPSRPLAAGRLGTVRPAAVLVAPNIHTDAQRIAELERRVVEAKSSADNSWMLVSSALVLLIGLRVSPEHENQGLDLSQHGEEGYNWEAS